MGKEKEGSIERLGGIARNGGIVAALLGALWVPGLILPGAALAAGGEVVRKLREKQRKKGK